MVRKSVGRKVSDVSVEDFDAVNAAVAEVTDSDGTVSEPIAPQSDDSATDEEPEEFSWDDLPTPEMVTYVRADRTGRVPWDPQSAPEKLRNLLDAQYERWKVACLAGPHGGADAGRAIVECTSIRQAEAFVKIGKRYCTALGRSFLGGIKEGSTVVFGVADPKRRKVKDKVSPEVTEKVESDTTGF